MRAEFKIREQSVVIVDGIVTFCKDEFLKDIIQHCLGVDADYPQCPSKGFYPFLFSFFGNEIENFKTDEDNQNLVY